MVDDTQLLAYLEGDLTEEEHAALSARLAQNPDLRVRLQALRDTRDRLRMALHARAGRAEAPSFAQLMQVSDGGTQPMMEQNNNNENQPRRPQPPMRGLVPGLSFVAAALILALGAVAALLAGGNLLQTGSQPSDAPAVGPDVVTATPATGDPMPLEICPTPVPYIVQEGDTWQSIAVIVGASAEEMQELNPGLTLEAGVELTTPTRCVEVDPDALTYGPGAVITATPVPTVTPIGDAAGGEQPSYLVVNTLPEGFYAARGVTVETTEGTTITEHRFYGNNAFVLVTETTAATGEPLPADATPITVRSQDAVLETGLSGTVQLTIEGLQNGAGDVVGGGGGGGGGGPQQEERLYPDAIDYMDGLRYTWEEDGRRIEVLTNLPAEEAAAFIDGMEWVTVNVGPIYDTEGLLPPLPQGARNTLLPIVLPPDATSIETVMVTVYDEELGAIGEDRYYTDGDFVIVTRREAQPGESTAEGSLLVRGSSATIERGVSGTALFHLDPPTLQDGIERPAFGAGTGGPTTYPETLPYEDALRITWVDEEGIRWEALTTLDETAAVAFLDEIIVAKPPAYDVTYPDGSSVVLEDVLILPLVPGTLPEGFGFTAVNAYEFGVVHLFQSEGGFILLAQQLAEGPLPEGEEIAVNTSTGVIRTGVTGNTEFNVPMAGVEGIEYEDAVEITWIEQGQRLTLLTTLSAEEALEVAASLITAEIVPVEE